jgi:signal transduction histidine kinase
LAGRKTFAPCCPSRYFQGILRPIKPIILWFVVFITSSSVLAQGEFEGTGPYSVYRRSKQMQLEYVEHLKKQLAADPDNVKLQLNLGRAYFILALAREGAAQFEAEKIFEQVLARDLNNAVALVYHGSLLGHKIGLNLVPQAQFAAVAKQAIEEVDRAVTLAPDSIEIRIARGYANFHAPSFLGRDPLVVEDFAHAIKLLESRPGTEADRAELYVTLGDAYIKLGDLDQARASWQRVSQLLPGSPLALAVDARRRSLDPQGDAAAVRVKEIASFFAFLIGAIIFAILTTLVTRDLIQARRRRGGMVASMMVSLTALLWNGLNLILVILSAVRADLAAPFEAMMGWSQHNLFLVAAISPIPFGLIAAYRFYQATFMDILLKRGAAVLVILGLLMIYAEVLEGPLVSAVFQVSKVTLRSVFLAGLWLGLFVLYPPLRNGIYRLVDRHLFKRRDYSQLLDWFHERLGGLTDEARLIPAAADAVREAFAADSVCFVPASDDVATRLSAALTERKSDIMLRRDIVDDELYAELEERRVELALAIRSGDERFGVILIGPRAYGQEYLSEELSVLRAVAAQIGRMLENLRLHEARRRHAIAEEELRKLAAEAELRALRAQIDPHFFFNALNSVAALISEDPAAAEELIEDISDLFRQSFKPSREFVSLSQELELVETYVKVEKVRLGEKLQFRKVISPEALTIKIPALTIQPLVENAVKHGVERSDHGGSVTLSAAMGDGRLSVFVADTGAGISPSDRPHIFTRGVGLANVNDRLVRLYGPESTLHVDSAPGQGTTVSFALPVTEERAQAVLQQP